VDSLLPEGPEWSEFMRPRKFRVKTMKLRGVLSQGLALPLALDKNTTVFGIVGYDASNVLRVTKYEPPLPQSQEIAGIFPPVIPKTDEVRIQSALFMLDDLRGKEWYATVKLDGTSATFANLNGIFHACSRNWEIKRGVNWYWHVVEKYELERVIEDGFAVQGEIMGPGVQKNRMVLKEIALFVFDVFDIRNGRRLDWSEKRAWCADRGLREVPHYGAGTSFDFTLDALLDLARGLYEGTQNRREGLVFRAITDQRASDGSRLSFKVISNDFLLHDED